METLVDSLKRAIRTGAPLYNEGKADECFAVYLDTCGAALEQDMLQNSAVGELLLQAVEESNPLAAHHDYKEAAWVLRRCFDEILQAGKGQQGGNRAILFAPALFKKTTISSSTSASNDDDDDDSSEDDDEDEDDDDEDEDGEDLSPPPPQPSPSLGSSKDEYQDEWTDAAVTDFEQGQDAADTAFILRASVQPAKHTRFTTQYADCFPATLAVELLTALGLAVNRKQATEKCALLWRGGLIVSVSHVQEQTFHDGTHLYRFPDLQELQVSLDKLLQDERTNQEGTEQRKLMIALQATLEIPTAGGIHTAGDVSSSSDQDDDDSADSADNTTTNNNSNTAPSTAVSWQQLQAKRDSQLVGEEVRGKVLAGLAASIESVVADRTYRFKKYQACFVGKEAVSAIVASNSSVSRVEAAEQLQDLLQVGLIHHVTREHSFEDAHLFYRFTSASDLKNSLDALSSLEQRNNNATSTTATPPFKGDELVRYAAVSSRYKQFAGLDIPTILNDFFGCTDESGWDLVDLENWRLNMKRWGFGKPKDRDDEMIDRLSPKLLNIDPDTWDKTGDEEWESPYGIIAQIALFGQISRSAFRGTSEAFKWDELAKRATRVAIEKGYFETAFKSTLNQFLILLPLEHSEDWEDQKLGVTLLLQLLSKVSVMDEGLSDYEIVKRLEFSKRLATAFLEHAQVVAKFKRYPHRNRAHGRIATLEERVWLASDLVPRWAKSQNPEDARNIITLPVIPLKRLTKK